MPLQLYKAGGYDEIKIIIDIHSNEQSFFDGIIFNSTFEC